eukprot:2776433-Pyramimonas_sp.AAC.1
MASISSSDTASKAGPEWGAWGPAMLLSWTLLMLNNTELFGRIRALVLVQSCHRHGREQLAMDHEAELPSRIIFEVSCA